ncbi:efflux RND transporter periplasmic adaptor subunit [Mucilaginibacter sp. X4EP1]|uniref:efflux RND transporter periplasmic adaptor subunit n=1 Tax=Mucilaginibacter sp. X4EP1 TaxID=2723092 RepID=UPI0021690BBD|nr:efflux RND transporter periplasmic adaptor subunit [Mucilaginibacter sp. X4EP1]MCS3815374.1 membrane fusion protein (multidrug efflux system) [Mucilaginibacter sp. X4EP1]
MNRVILNTIFISCLVVTACKKKQPPVNPEVPVNLMTLKAKRVLYFDKYPSTTQALSQVNLLPQVTGGITGIFFKEGTHVEKGQKLYEIDQRIYQAAYDQAVANLRVSQGTLVQSQQDADRYEYLNKYNAVAKQLYDHAVITLENSKATVKASEQQVKTAKTNLAYSVVYAPFTGTIGFSQVKLGDVVTPGTTILNTISTDNPMAVDFIINEKNLPFFEKLQTNKENVDSLFTILLPDNSLYPYNGKISVIDRAVDSQTGSIRVRLVFDNPKSILRVGMSCVVRVHNQETTPVLVLPSKAVVEQMGEYFVFTAKDSVINVSKDSLAKNPQADVSGKPRLFAHQKKVMVGQTIGPNVIVKSGVNEGEKIITDGVQTLHDGSPVTTKNKVAPTQGKGR